MAPMTLTILGAGPAAPNRDGACSGYLVQQNGTAVLMDCGSGIAGRLVAHCPPRRLDGVAISHFHPDHYFDLVALYYGLKFGEQRRSRLPVWIPPGGRDFLDRFGQLIADKASMLEDVFELREYPLQSPVSIGGLEVTF